MKKAKNKNTALTRIAAGIVAIRTAPLFVMAAPFAIMNNEKCDKIVEKIAAVPIAAAEVALGYRVI